MTGPGYNLNRRDDCEFCLGAKNGVPGNENRYAARNSKKILACDYCSLLVDSILAAAKEIPK